VTIAAKNFGIFFADGSHTLQLTVSEIPRADQSSVAAPSTKPQELTLVLVAKCIQNFAGSEASCLGRASTSTPPQFSTWA